MTHHIHFGVYPVAEGAYPLQSIRLDGHSDPSVEHEVDIPDVMRDSGIQSIWVTGSWACWGPADQGSEGDDSLHVVVLTDHAMDAQHVANLRSFVEFSLPDSGSGPVHVVDYAHVTTGDWGEPTHVATFGGNPWCCLYSLTEDAFLDGCLKRPLPPQDVE